MRITVEKTELFLRNLTLRIPFRFGIVLMTHTPHLIVRLTAQIDGRTVRGYAADNLIPKWFTKDPNKAYRDEIDEMFAVIEHAAGVAEAVEAPTVFGLWQQVGRAQGEWARKEAIPPLLAGFGVSLVERAAIDAWCRAAGKPFGEALRDGDLGLDLGAMHSELAGRSVSEFLPAQPARRVIARHTVGLADALTAEDFTADAPSPNDGLPAALDEIIRAYGLTHFKIKLSGDGERDRARLRRIAEVIEREATGCAFTLDGNENFHSVAPFRALWEELHADPALRRFLRGLIFVEQPFHRGVALSEALAADLLAWSERPPIIIDESDAEFDSLPRALAGGYAGTSHKNCKGVFHGIGSACLIAHRRTTHPGGSWYLSAEDLTNLGPVAVQQDLAALATLGIEHAERNGHHYFAGLSQFPVAVQEAAIRHHGDLYTRHRDGFPTVSVKSGALEIGSVVDAPFGVGFEPDLAQFIPRAEWRFESMEACGAG